MIYMYMYSCTVHVHSIYMYLYSTVLCCTVAYTTLITIVLELTHVLCACIYMYFVSPQIGLFAKISLQNCPGLARLLKDGEDLSDLLKLSPEEILLRWFNYHLEQAGHPRQVRNFSGDIKVISSFPVLAILLSMSSVCLYLYMGCLFLLFFHTIIMFYFILFFYIRIQSVTLFC